MPCDLHAHSYFSDGTLSPAELVALAKEKGLTLALTDHNTASGLSEFLSEGERQGVTVLPGTELSTIYKGTELHLLGLFITPEHFAAVERTVKEFKALKEINNLELIERLNEAGYHIDYPSVRRRNPEGNVNRAHVAAELLEKGYVSSVAEAFSELLADGKGFYTPPERFELMDAIAFLRGIDALPVLAHPLQELTAEQLTALLPEAKERGLVGIETMHSSYDEQAIATAKKIAADFDLLESGGSDFHGEVKPDISLGVGKGNLLISDDIYSALLSRYSELKQA